MKRLKFHRAIVAIAMTLIGWLPSLAHDFEVDGVFYNKTSDNTVAVTYKGYYSDSYTDEYEGNIVIPSSVDYNGATYSVTSIGDETFFYCLKLTSMEIPNSVTSIGDNAFVWCTGLTSIVVDAGNTIYDSRNECNAIIETASNTLISGCKNTIIPNSVTSIGYGAFACSTLKSIEIPNSVTSIGDEAFGSCKLLTSIEIPNSVTSIGYEAFAYCPSLTSIEIPNSVTSIGDYAFNECSSLTSIVVDSGNTEYDSRNGCNAIIETASNTLIAGCQNTIIPNSVTSIGDWAFEYCISLTSIEIPNSVASIGNYAFSECSSLTSIQIPNSVTSIGNYAFSECSSLTSIQIPNSVTSIGGKAFYGCYSLTSIQIPNSVTSIEDSTFKYCSSLTSIEIPNSVTSIGVCAFSGCSSLTGIQIPNSVTSIGNWAFEGCESLTKITCLAITPPTIQSSTFTNYSADLYVPAGCISAYQSANHWKKFYNIKEIPTLSTSIALNKTSVSLKVTETLTLVATVLPELTTNKSLTWTSSNEAVATVDVNGVVTAIALGEATITATTTDGTNLSASCQVTVVPTLVVSIEVTPNSVEAEENSEVQLSVNILPENATYKSVEWSSSNDAVASVDNNGFVTVYAVGEAIITATTTDGTNLSATCCINVYSGIDGVNGNDVIVATVGDNIVVKNAPLGSVVNVYSSNGALIKSMTATDGSVVIEAPIKGMYVVAIDGKSFKVMVN